MSDKGGKKSSSSSTGLPSLDDVLKGVGDANTSNPNGQNQGFQKRAQTKSESLDDLLKKGNNTKLQTSKTKRASEVRTSDLADIGELVNARPEETSASSQKATSANKSEKSLNQIIGSLQSEDKISQEKESLDVRGYNKSQVLSLAFIGLLVAIVIGVFMSQHNQQSLPESVVVQQLKSIVDGIEKYHQENDRTPDKLSDLPEFPIGAVEWPVDQYELQLETSALEFFYFEDAKGYIVISRYEDEAWLYTDTGNPKIKRVPIR